MPLAAFPKCYLDAILVERSMTTEAWIDLASSELDVDGLELYWPLVADLGPARLDALRRRSEDQGLSIPMMCVSPDFTQPLPADHRREVEQYRRVLESSARLGVRFSRVLSGQRRPQLDLEEGLQLAADGIVAVMDDARALGITLILENHFKDHAWSEPELAREPAAFHRLLELLPDDPVVRVNYDPSNALTAGADPVDFLRSVIDRVVSMHASDRFAVGDEDSYAALRHGIIGRGRIDYDGVFAVLRDDGFDGWISIEDGDDPEVGLEHLRESAEFLRAKMAEHGLS